MKKRELIGRRIVDFRQSRQDTNVGVEWGVDWIRLDNEQVLYFLVSEGPDNYVIRPVLTDKNQ